MSDTSSPDPPRASVNTWLQAGAIALSLLAMLFANERNNEATRQKLDALTSRTVAVETKVAESEREDAARDQAYARLDEKLTYAIKLLEGKS